MQECNRSCMQECQFLFFHRMCSSPDSSYLDERKELFTKIGTTFYKIYLSKFEYLLYISLF